MAFSGQYAAAQLHHLPLPHLVIGELSDYLGYAPNFAPPSYVRWARILGRLPLDGFDVGDTFAIRAFEHELSTYRGPVNARCMRLRNAKLESLFFTDFTLWEIRYMNEHHLLIYDIVARVEYTRDDFLFRRAWLARNRFDWPHVPRPFWQDSDMVHHTIRRGIYRYVTFINHYGTHGDSVSNVINRYNSALNVFRAFSSADDARNYDSDSD